MTLGKTSIYLEHCRERAKIANQRTSLLRRIKGTSWGAKVATLKRVYKQFIRPVLEYGSVAYTKQDILYTKHLEIAERRALRYITGAKLRTSNEVLYSMANIQPLCVRMEDLPRKAIKRLSNNIQGINDLERLKEMLGVRAGQEPSLSINSLGKRGK